MRRIDMRVMLPILGLGALAFMLGSSKKSSTAGAVFTGLPKQRTGSGVTNANNVNAVANGAVGYPSNEAGGDTLPPLQLIKPAAKANGAS